MLNIIWDFDGTLIDSSEDIEQCFKVAANEAGLDLSKQISQFVIGPSIEIILRKSFPPGIVAEKVVADTIKVFREIYDNSNYEQTKPYPGIELIIQDTVNFKHHIVTNKPDLPTNRIIDKLNWAKYIASVNTPYTKIASSGNSLQSKRDIYTDVMNKYKGTAFTYVGIGDTKTDSIAAKENHITAVGVSWGFGDKDELREHSDYVFDDTQQLRCFLYDMQSNIAHCDNQQLYTQGGLINA